MDRAALVNTKCCMQLNPADNPNTPVLPEALIHLNFDEVPHHYGWIKILIPASVQVDEVCPGRSRAGTRPMFPTRTAIAGTGNGEVRCCLPLGGNGRETPGPAPSREVLWKRLFGY
jgi:hypothetical protein